jgi:hypothetical protein
VGGDPDLLRSSVRRRWRKQQLWRRGGGGGYLGVQSNSVRRQGGRGGFGGGGAGGQAITAALAAVAVPGVARRWSIYGGAGSARRRRRQRLAERSGHAGNINIRNSVLPLRIAAYPAAADGAKARAAIFRWMG